jgi:hypothetical protein
MLHSAVDKEASRPILQLKQRWARRFDSHEDKTFDFQKDFLQKNFFTSKFLT